jgi:hypothetical protein
MKLNFSNHQSVKFEITQFTQTAEQYFNAINDIRGNTSSGEEFESVVLKSLNYFFLNCVNPSHLDVDEWSLSFAKSLLDRNNFSGFTPVLSADPSRVIQVNECEYYKECFALIQFAYYINEIALHSKLQKTQFYIYIKHYLETGVMLPDSEYKYDLEYLHKKYKDYKKSKTTPEKTLYFWFNGALLILLKDLGLSVKNFKCSYKNGREYNALTNVPRDFRKFFPFVLRQYDIKSANPNFVDNILGSSVANNVYSDLMFAHNITRNQAKRKFNSMLNMGAKGFKREFFVNFFGSTYKEHTDKLIDLITAKDVLFWERMQLTEEVVIKKFIAVNGLINGTRLHDAVFMIDSKNAPSITTKIDSFELECTLINAPSQSLNFMINKKRTKYSYVGSIPSGIKSNWTTEFDNKANGLRYQGKAFDIYLDEFEYMKANFNIVNTGHNSENGWVYLTEEDFVKKCINSILVIRDLNPDKSANELRAVIDKIVSHMVENSAYGFTSDVLIGLMCDAVEDFNAKPIIKTKSWYFKGNQDAGNLDFYEFSKLLNETRVKARLYFGALKMLPIVEESFKNKRKMYIDMTRLGFNNRRECELLYEIAESFNIANGFGSLKFANNVKGFLDMYISFASTLKENTNKVANQMYIPTESAIAKGCGVHRQTAKKILHWVNQPQDTHAVHEILFNLKAITENTKDIKHEIVKVENRLIVKKVIETERKTYKLPQLTPMQAFGEIETQIETIDDAQHKFHITRTINRHPDFTHSSLNTPPEVAIYSNPAFLVSWYIFQNKGISEDDRSVLLINLERSTEYIRHLYWTTNSIQFDRKQFNASRESYYASQKRAS